MNYPTVKQLRYFVALNETHHFGRAAASCFVSQSAFSKAIQELEAVLDTQLVDRTNRQVTITSVGQEVATQARLCLRDIESLVDIAGEQRLPLCGDLRLGVIPTIAPFMLPAILPRLRKAYPDLRLFLEEDQTRRIHQRLLDGDLDLLLLALPFELRSVEQIPLFNDRFLLACHEKTKRVDPSKKRLNPLELASVLLLKEGHCLRDHALDACKLRDTKKVSQVEATSLLTLIEMVDADFGVTFLPEMAAGSSLLRHTHVKTYATDEGTYRTIGLAWRKGSNRSDEFKLFGKFLSEHRD